jgi:uncharacterized membrane protein
MHKLLEYLLNLKTISLRDPTHVRFAFGMDTYWLTILVLVAILLAVVGYWSYRDQSASPAKRVAAGLMRALTLAFVVLLFCRPQLAIDQEIRTPSVVAVWIDNSLSMDLRDPYKDIAMKSVLQQVGTRIKLPAGVSRPSRWELAVDALQQAKKNWLHTLAEKQDVVLLTGSVHPMPIGAPAHNPEQLDALLDELKTQKPVVDSTDVPTVISDIFRQLQGQPVSAIVLLTDGASNAGTRADVATAQARQNSTNIFAIPLGSPDEPFNLALQSLQVPENSFVRDPVAVKARLHAAGITQPTPTRVTLYRKLPDGKPGEVLKSLDVTVDPSKKDMDIEMTFKPDKAERIDLLARVDANPDELTAADNSVTGTTTVMDAKVRALLVEGYPRWEFRYLKNEYIREKTVDVSCLLLSADENFAQEGDVPITRFPETEEEMNNYDVLVIGDVDPQFFSPTQRKLIINFVGKKGGGLAWIAGSQFNPDSYKGTELEPLLPIVPDDPNSPITTPCDGSPFHMTMTPEGRDSNLFRFFDSADDNARQLSELPPLYWYKPVIGKKASGIVYANIANPANGSQPIPLLVVGQYGLGRTLFSAVCDTWRWRYYVGEPLYQSYWLQMARLLYRNKAMNQSRQIEIAADAQTVDVGGAIHLSAVVHDPLLVGQMPLEIPLQVIDIKNHTPLEPVILKRLANAPDQFEGTFTGNQLGKFQAQVRAGVLPIEVPPIDLEVSPASREQATAAADLDALGALVNPTKGKIIPLPLAAELAKDVADRSVQSSITESEDLWNKPIALVLILAFLTIEWLIRKSSGLI